MPGKKKSKGKKGGKSGKKSGGGAPKGGHSDPFAPKDELPPPPRTGESLIKLLTTHPVGERDLYGMKISTRALDNLTPQEISDLKIVFEAFDYRNHGYIGAVDVRRAMRALGFQVSRDQARQMVEETGLKGEGVVDFDEFLDLVIAQQGDSRDVYDEILQGFKMFDYENSGKISMDDLKQACTDANVKFSKEELQDMMIEADLNGDGYVDQEEFIKIMLQTNLF